MQGCETPWGNWAQRGSSEGVVTAGDLDAIPALERLRDSDPAVYIQGERKQYWIREQAGEAIRKIREHPLIK